MRFRSGIGVIDLNGNDWVLGEYVDEAPIIVGGVAVVLLMVIIGVIVSRRRRDSFDD